MIPAVIITAAAVVAALLACDVRDAVNFPPRDVEQSHDGGDAR